MFAADNRSAGRLRARLRDLSSYRLSHRTFFSDNTPGVHIMVVRDDSVMYSRSVGVARFDSLCMISPETMFNVAASSKSFSAAAILKLAEQGKLSLDDPLSKFFTRLDKAIFNGVTLRHVLSHSTGLPDVRPRNSEQWTNFLKNNTSPFSYEQDYTLYGRERDYGRTLLTIDSITAMPGSSYDAQDVPYMLLAMIVERVTGQSFESWMRENIFEPAGLEHIVYFEPERRIPNMAHAYAVYVPGRPHAGTFITDDHRWAEYDYGESEYFLTKADKGIYTTGRDYLRWIDALLEGKVISKESLKMAYSPIIETDKEGIFYGFGHWVRKNPDESKKVFHTSCNGGFYIHDANFPAKNVSYVVFANRRDWPMPRVVEGIDSVLKVKHWI